MLAPADSPAWDRAVGAAYRLRGFEIAGADARLRLFAARRGGTIANAPYIDFGGIEVPASGLDDTLVERLFELRRSERARCVLLKSRPALCAPRPGLVIDADTHAAFDLDLRPGADAIWSDALSGKTRNQVRKAERGGFTGAFGGAELLDDFYAVIARCWRDLGTPVHARRFFAAILENFGDECRVYVLRDGALPIAGALLFTLGDTLHHPFAGTINPYKPSSANNLLYWNIIRDACERGLARFDMGRSRRNAGTFRFKRSWGAEPVAVHSHYFVDPGQPPPRLDAPAYRLATATWQRLPLPIANALGPLLIRNVIQAMDPRCRNPIAHIGASGLSAAEGEAHFA